MFPTEAAKKGAVSTLSSKPVPHEIARQSLSEVPSPRMRTARDALFQAPHYKNSLFRYISVTAAYFTQKRFDLESLQATLLKQASPGVYNFRWYRSGSFFTLKPSPPTPRLPPLHFQATVLFSIKSCSKPPTRKWSVFVMTQIPPSTTSSLVWTPPPVLWQS